MIERISAALAEIDRLNPGRASYAFGKRRSHRLRKVLVANRGEIAKRFFLALREEGIPSVAVVTDPDRDQSWADSADELIRIGDSAAYINTALIVAAAIRSGANAIYPGYGFLSENADLPDAVRTAGETFQTELIFMGPSAAIMKRAGNKLDARSLAMAHDVPVFPGSGQLRGDTAEVIEEAARVGYPVILKLDAGGGGKGMCIVRDEAGLPDAIRAIQRIGRANYDNDAFYVERFVDRPVHYEVQIFNGMAVGLRKCAVQRRNQKVIEESGDAFLDASAACNLLTAAEKMALASGYADGGGAGTVEFLYDVDRNAFGFLEMNTRLQVEYAVTDSSLGIDLVKWQIWQFDGRSELISALHPHRERPGVRDHAIQCRIYAEDAFNDYAPAPGHLTEIILPSFNGIRCDFGFQTGDDIVPDYDPMIGKLIAHGANREEAIMRMQRALSELYVRGVVTNVDQLLRIVRHPVFRAGNYTNRLLDECPELTDIALDAEFRVEAAIAAAMILHCRERAAALRETLSDIRTVLDNQRIQRLSSSFSMECCEETIEIEFLQCEAALFHVRVDGRYAGTLGLSIRSDESLRLRYGDQSYVVRADLRPNGMMILRMTERAGRVNYYRMKARSVQDGSVCDPAGMVRAPFRGSFVKFCEGGSGRLQVGDHVRAGQPIIVISAMKMETTIQAGADGTLSYLADDGDLSRLILGHTPAGLVRGRAFDEGEVLFVINMVEERASASGRTMASNQTFVSDNFLDHLKTDSIARVFERDVAGCFAQILDLIRAAVLGYYDDTEALTRIAGILASELNFEDQRIELLRPFAGDIASLLRLYSKIRYAFSPALCANLARAGEGLYRFYGEPSGRTEKREALFFMLRGWLNAASHSSLFSSLSRIVRKFPEVSGVAITLSRLIQIEEAEGHDELAQEFRSALQSLRPGGLKDREGYAGFNRKFSKVFREFKRQPCLLLGVEHDSFCAAAAEAMGKPSLTEPPCWLPPRIRQEIEAKIAFLGRDYNISSLPAGNEGLVLYALRRGTSAAISEFLCFSYLREGCIVAERGVQGEIVGSPNLEHSLVRAAALLSVYTKHYGGVCRLEILGDDRPSQIDLASCDPAVWNHSNLVNLGHAVLPFFFNLDIRMLTLDLAVLHPIAGVAERKQLFYYMKSGRLGLGLMLPEDPMHPYYVEQSAGNRRLFERGKWPVEIWARECLDPGSMEEIVVPSIDEAGCGARAVVGAKVFRGRISGLPCLFFMKDSRVAGGATGDLEGRKFIAAAYLAYLTNTPLYVWNDGAGANIKEGMVALNRAAEGFMMNALIAEAAPHDRFRAYTRNCADPVIVSLFHELDVLFNLDNRAGVDCPKNVFLAAVGVGSSTGLDVYGSSQASVQVMLDSENSYRVLTGSTIVRSVTGENLSNYELGGARVMGQQTGVVDLVAADKTELLEHIRSIHEVFSRVPGAEDSAAASCDLPARFVGQSDFSERLLRAYADDGRILPFKEAYRGANSLLGGFARLAGQPVLIMGPRGEHGCATLSAIIRAKELLQTARKTGSHRILVYGRSFLRRPCVEAARAARVLLDFSNELRRRRGLAIHIVTDNEGLDLTDLNASADVVILVTPSEAPSENGQAERAAAFRVCSLDAALALARRLIGQLTLESRSLAPAGAPELRSDPSLPFDMQEDIVARVFDPDSFLEFYADWREPFAGPSLITGIARLAGHRVAVIADQPAKGLAPDAPGTEKFRVFMEFVARCGLPLVMLSNAPGFTPGAKQERLRIQQIGAESLDVNILSQIPVVSVVLNQNYGGRQIHAFSKFLRPGIVYISMEHSILAVMGASAAFDLFKGKEYAERIERGDISGARELTERFTFDFNTKSRADRDAAGVGLMDRMLVDASGLRSAIIESLETARERAWAAFGPDNCA